MTGWQLCFHTPRNRFQRLVEMLFALLLPQFFLFVTEFLTLFTSEELMTLVMSLNSQVRTEAPDAFFCSQAPLYSLFIHSEGIYLMRLLSASPWLPLNSTSHFLNFEIVLD